MKNNKVYLIMYGAISLLWLASCVKDDRIILRIPTREQ